MALPFIFGWCKFIRDNVSRTFKTEYYRRGGKNEYKNTKDKGGRNVADSGVGRSGRL
ncbi:MAG: hypothetical protein UX30_C0023G0007 [Candidatus Saccharibacteria bacterium GW2011_GWA2_46_10]|nr:MAG: hypothetical protein UX30_C0023G0007 [Candidatus Saccharibacteria bacterium GW2011_GWA2_46_10]